MRKSCDSAVERDRPHKCKRIQFRIFLIGDANAAVAYAHGARYLRLDAKTFEDIFALWPCWAFKPVV
jgi:hypothetical protein